MNEFIFIVGFLVFVALVLNFLRTNNQPTLSDDLIEKINFTMGTENQYLKEENRTLQIKNLLFKEWLIRSYIEQYYRKKLLAGDHQIYTVDALADLNAYAKTALDNFENTWNSKICNEQCDWIKEYLEVIICKTDTILNNNTWGDILNSENEQAFSRFFVAVETTMLFDRNAKEKGTKLEKLTYWRPQEDHDDLC
jgi:hypothetical protein